MAGFLGDSIFVIDQPGLFGQAELQLTHPGWIRLPGFEMNSVGSDSQFSFTLATTTNQSIAPPHQILLRCAQLLCHVEDGARSLVTGQLVPPIRNHLSWP